MEILNGFFNGYFKQNTTETGPSMVEILGVLAVMGVLSAGGIYGYSFAMDKYRANDIVYEVNLRANDVWHKYQEQPLPDPSEDGTDFDEFPDMTGTGYPIYMTSHPDVAFKTYVEGVSSRVCKNVVNMNLNGIVQGIRYVQVAQGDGDLVKYTGDVSICGEDETDNTIVFTSFLDSDGRNGTSGQSGDPCVEDMDCSSPCGNATCDTDKMTCKNSCTGTSTPYCYSDGGEAMCVSCLTNKDCQHLGEGYICYESFTNAETGVTDRFTCQKFQKTCAEDEFRTQNGACVKCDNAHNYIVLQNGEPYPESSDETDGFGMCNRCTQNGQTRWSGSLSGAENEGKAYCSYMCTEGYSYQSKSGQCIACSDDNHNWISDDIAKRQCTACEGHEWYKVYLGDAYCRSKLECTEDQFIALDFDNKRLYCANCGDKRNDHVLVKWETESSIDGIDTVVQDACNNCPKTKDKARWYNVSNTFESNGWDWRRYCYPVCEQPESGSIADTICKTDPSNDQCKRKWQNVWGNCYDCNAVSGNFKISTNATLIQLCEACGRKVQDGYCKPIGNMCGDGQFLGQDGICYDCRKTVTNKGIAITSEEESGCIANCKKISATDTTFSKEGTIEERRTYTRSKVMYCAPKCADNYINNSSGECVSCGDDKSTSSIVVAVDDDCSKQCSYRDIYKTHWGSFCALKECPNTDTTRYFRNNVGSCVLCTANNDTSSHRMHPTQDIERIDICHECGNRMTIPLQNQYDPTIPYCSKVEFNADGTPNVGICNHVENDYYNAANLNASLKEKANYYVSREYLKDTNSIKYFRSDDGVCRSCNTATSYNSTQAQCNLCGNRRWQNNTCSKGLCEEGKHFLNTSQSCIDCTNEKIKINLEIENMCSRCENRRVLNTGETSNSISYGLCVSVCAGSQWQDINGNCLLCSEGGNRSIGLDSQSVSLCNACEGRTAEITAEDGEGNPTAYQCVLE